MNNKKKMIISIVIVLFIAIVVVAATYAYIMATTNEGATDTIGSGKLDINYQKPDDFEGRGLAMSNNRDGGLKAIAKASLKEGSETAILNMYITPTVLYNLNIPALKWEAEGVRGGKVICSGSGDFSTAVVGEPIKLFINDINDNISDCVLTNEETIFNIYVWLDASLVTTSIGGLQFSAKIGADSVPITGDFGEEM